MLSRRGTALTETVPPDPTVSDASIRQRKSVAAASDERAAAESLPLDALAREIAGGLVEGDDAPRDVERARSDRVLLEQRPVRGRRQNRSGHHRPKAPHLTL